MNDLRDALNEILPLEGNAAPGHDAAGPPPHEHKLPDVDKFDGNPKNSFQFLSQLNVFFHLQPRRFALDIAKCYYFGLRCDGPAQIWFNSVLIGPDAAQIMPHYDQFVADFNLTFADPTRVQDAERRLLTMKQGKRSVAQTIPEFKINVFVAGWEAENLFRVFLNILNDDVRDELLKEERPNNLQAYMNRAIAIDRQLFERRLDQKSRTTNALSRALVPARAPRQNDAMVVDQVLVQRNNGISNDERNRRRRNNLCLYCGQPGHVVRECPSKN